MSINLMPQSDSATLAAQLKCALIREVHNRKLITPDQFSQLMELQRGR